LFGPLRQLSLLELSRLEHPDWGDADRVALLAADVVRELDEYPPIRLTLVASYRDIVEIRVEPMDYAGSLTPESRGLVMRLRAGDSRRRRRFTGFHEVAHTFQAGFAEIRQFRCQPSFKRVRQLDKEALSDIAASELLLPRRFFKADLVDSPFGLAAVAELAAAYDASIQATAHRVVAFWPDPCLLVLLESKTKPIESGDIGAEPKLRVVWAYGHPAGRWPYIPPHKSAEDGGVLARAFAGEQVDEPATLSDLGREAPAKLEVSARTFSYRAADGAVRPQVLALYRQTERVPQARFN
jgi:hypothetical protein